MPHFIILFIFLLSSTTLFAAQTDDISTYTGTDHFVYDTTSRQWYALNNLGHYEPWGVVEAVTRLATATTYEGKYVRQGRKLYLYANGRWTLQPVEALRQPALADGVYVVDAGGRCLTLDDWETFTPRPSGVAVVDGGKGFVVAPRVFSLNKFASLAATAADITCSATVGDGKGGVRATQDLVRTLDGSAIAATACSNYLFTHGEKGFLPSATEAQLVFAQHGEEVEEAMATIDGWAIDEWEAVATATMQTPLTLWSCSSQGILSGTDINAPCQVIPFGILPSVCFADPYPAAPDEGVAPSHAITFVDARAETLCLRNWDGDGDGVFTYEEAAAVRDIDWTFNNEGIVSLDELVFFTGIKTIYGESFINCPNLASIIIPANVTSVGYEPFRSCPKLPAIRVDDGNMNYSSDEGVLMDRRKTTLVRCPEGKTGSYAMPASTTFISAGAFMSSKLSSIEVAAAVYYIDLDAFANCSNLLSVKVHWPTPLEPSSAIFTSTKVANATLYVPTGTAQAYAASSTWGKFGSIVEYDDTEAHFIAFNDAEVEAVCLSHWDKNGDGRLSEAEAAAVMSLDGAFRGNDLVRCFTELQYFTGLTAIGESEFEGCRLLEGITIPSQVTAIGDRAFHGCFSFAIVSIPAAVTSIGTDVFEEMVSLRGVNAASASRYFKSTGGVLYDKAGTTLVKYPNTSTSKSFTIPSTVKKVLPNAFRDAKNLSSVTIPASVTSLGANAFHGCTGLISVTTSSYGVGEYTFAGCTALTKATLTGRGRTFANGVFANCPSLTEVDIATTPTTIGANAFAGTAVGTLPFANMIGMRNTTTTAFGDYAFAGCKELRRACLPSSLTSLGASCFEGCEALALVRMPAGLATIGRRACYTKGETSGNCALSHVLVEGAVPLAIDTDCFADYAGCLLLVPMGSMDDYGCAAVWSGFGNMKPLFKGDIDLDGVVSVTDVMTLVDYIIANSPVKMLCPMQLDVNQDGYITVADVTALVDIILGN
ncbi:MAG: leucine-rich repeat protein [Prevotella sp.]|nr:leucine-rich repeat protein [Prevotella sp.]